MGNKCLAWFKRLGFALSLLFFFSFFLRAADAGKLAPELEQVLSQAPPDSEITVLVRPALEVEINALEKELSRRRASRAERHRRVIVELKRKSKASQAGLLAELEAGRVLGQVWEYRSFWITNLVAVTATIECIRKLAARQDVAGILENKTVNVLPLKDGNGSPADIDSLSISARLASASKKFNWALQRINVRRLWERGITGRGVLVAIIDTGVDGNHPALRDKWRGANGFPVSRSWFDVWKEHTHFPVDHENHGTSVMGCLVGQDGADTTGVAPDAQWIAACYSASVDTVNQEKTERIEHKTETKILECFEWTADPDGDPETVDDVPDVLGNSWIFSEADGCFDTFDEAVNNLKALDVIVIFAAGNDGPNMGVPAAKPEFFAVGALTQNDYLAFFSGRGPSFCDRVTIKPDLVAPGVNILVPQDLNYGASYRYADGTSLSAPLVAGVAALLRQCNPELNPDEIIRTIRSSAIDMGPPGPDNAYGWGLVDAEAAFNLLKPSTSPNLLIGRIEITAGWDELISPGEQARIILHLTNTGVEANAVTAELVSNSADVTVISGMASFGDIGPHKQASNSLTPFLLAFSSQIPENVTSTFSLRLATGELIRTLSFNLKVVGVMEPPEKGVAFHSVGKVGLLLTNYGVIGSDSDNGGGFQYPYTGSVSPDHLYRGSLLIATGPATVSDATFNEYTRNDNVSFDSDFSPVAGGNIQVFIPGRFADLEVTGAFTDNLAANPLGVAVYQRSYAWSAEADDDYVIVEYAFSLVVGLEALTGIYLAQHLDWDVGTGYARGDNDLVGFDTELRLAYMYDNVSNAYVGHALLTHPVAGFRAINYQQDISDGFTGEEKFSFMTSGIDDTLIGVPDDWSELLSAGPLTLSSDREVFAAFALAGGGSLKELRANTRAAYARYQEISAVRSTRPILSCDFNGDGMINIIDVISLLLFQRDNPGEPKGDFNRNGITDIADAFALLVALNDGTCADANPILAGLSELSEIPKIEGLSRAEIEYIEQTMSLMNLIPENKAALSLALYGKTGTTTLSEAFSLGQNFPNPFNPATAISYCIPAGRSVHLILNIYDLRGRLVRTLVDEARQGGTYEVFWDGTDQSGRRVSSGTYLYRLQAGDFVRTRKMVLLK
ncbi:MAG TPA: S8 family serine peptidase [archaeon]|nr:S8 family serine peptidase [archaeon]